MVGITGPTITFTRAVPGPAHGVSNVTSDSGMCGTSELPGQASSAADRYGYEWCSLLAPARGRNMMLVALTVATTAALPVVAVPADPGRPLAGADVRLLPAFARPGCAAAPGRTFARAYSSCAALRCAACRRRRRAALPLMRSTMPPGTSAVWDQHTPCHFRARTGGKLRSPTVTHGRREHPPAWTRAG